MNPKMIIIAGYLASGKSTFALRLSKELGIPYFVKDTLKSAICANIPISTREESRRFSAATFNAIAYVAERLMEAGDPFIIEGNFVMGDPVKANEGGVLRRLIDQYRYQSLTFLFTADPRVLCDRFNEREKLPQRGEANRAFTVHTYENFGALLPSHGDFSVGGSVIQVDTTDFEKVNYPGLISAAHGFISS